MWNPAFPPALAPLKKRFLVKWRAIPPSDISAGAFRLQMFPLWQKSLCNNTVPLVIFLESARRKRMRNRNEDRLWAVVSIRRWGIDWNRLLTLLSSRPDQGRTRTIQQKSESHPWGDKVTRTASKLTWKHSPSANQQGKLPYYFKTMCFRKPWFATFALLLRH